MIIFKRVIYIFLLLPLSINLVYGQKMSREEYIEKYKDIAIRQMKEYGIPASIILAQACLESGNGNSELAIKANNHFGIKCHNWDGKSFIYDDDKKNECFRKYKCVEDSFKDHSEFLRTGKRYSSLFELKSTDYKGWAFGLKAAGYATNPRYAQILINDIEKYNLHKYDIEQRNRKETSTNTTSSSSSLSSSSSSSLKNNKENNNEYYDEVIIPAVNEKRLKRMEKRKKRMEEKQAKKMKQMVNDDFFNRY